MTGINDNWLPLHDNNGEILYVAKTDMRYARSTWVVACSDALDEEKARADLILPGGNDVPTLNTFLNDRARWFSTVYFSSGHVYVGSTPSWGNVRLVGCQSVYSGGASWRTQLLFNGPQSAYTAGFAGPGSTIPIIYGFDVGSSGWIESFTINNTTTGTALPFCAFLCGSIGVENWIFRDLHFANSSVRYIFGGGRSIPNSVFEKFWNPSGTCDFSIDTSLFGGVSSSYVADMRGINVVQGSFGSSYLLFTTIPASTVPLAGNIIVPGVSALGGLTTNHILVGSAAGNAADVAMSGDATIVASGAVTLKNTGPGATGPLGSATRSVLVTCDAQGRITALTDVAIAIPENAVTGLVTDLANFSSDIALRAPIANPTFTGDPKAPTPTAGDNDTSIATTAFVTAAVAAVPSVASLDALLNMGYYR